jgi:hypothetical protein
MPPPFELAATNSCVILLKQASRKEAKALGLHNILTPYEFFAGFAALREINNY